MNKIVFTEEFCSPENLFPFTLTRQIQDIRVGILTIREKWELYLGLPSFDKQEDDYKDLEKAIIIHETIGRDTIYLIHGNILPNERLVNLVKKLKPGEAISAPQKEAFIYCISQKQVINEHKIKIDKAIEFKEAVKEVKFPWDIFQLNAGAIKDDFELLKGIKKRGWLSSTNKLTLSKNFFIEKGAEVEHCYLNASEGPIYIARGALIMEGSMLRGPVAVCEDAVVKMGAKLYGGSTIGPFCTVGGEIKNTVLFANSNKAHDGYLGDAVIGAWCNLGAGTTCSNVKNNASVVSVYTPSGQIKVGLKCGVLMGDYSRTAINTAINTGTVIGACANVFGTGLTPKYIPSFAWGSDGIQRYELEKAYAHIDNWKRLKNGMLTDTETAILAHIFNHY